MLMSRGPQGCVATVVFSRMAIYLCQLIVAGGTSKREKTFSLLSGLMDAPALIQQLPHCANVSTTTRLRQGTCSGKYNLLCYIFHIWNLSIVMRF